MARHRFGGVADYVITLGTDDVATFQPGATVTCWNAATAGIQYTDLTETDGTTPIPNGELTADANGAVPEFMGPDGVRSLYFDANAGAGPRRRTVPTDVGDNLGTVEMNLSTHSGDTNPHATTVASLTDATADPVSADVKGGGRLTYDAVTARWRPDGASQALMGWHADLANRHYERANIVCIGDSITEGQGITDSGNSWPARLRQLLRSRFPTTGVAGGRGWLGAQSTGSTGFTWPATITGGPVTNDNWGPSKRVIQLDAAAPADRISYAALQGTAADIMWTQFDLGGNFQWRVDGGSWTTVATAGTQQDGILTRVSLGASGAHSLDIEANSEGFQAWVSGIVAYDGDENAGITVHNCAHFGYDTSFWNANFFSNSWPAAIAALNPGLVIIMLGANDQFLGTDPDVFRSNLGTLMSNLRAATPAPSPYPPILVAMHAARGGTFDFTWSQYVDAAHTAVKDDANAVVHDFTLGRRLPDQAGSPNFGLYADTTHLSNKGNSYIADRIADFIAPK